MRETMFHLGSDVVYSPLDDTLKEYAGKAEVCGINMRGTEEVYLLLLKESKERISASYEEINVAGAKPRATRSTTRTTKMSAASLKNKTVESDPATAVNQVVSITPKITRTRK